MGLEEGLGEERLGGVRRPEPASVYVALLQCGASHPMVMPRALGFESRAWEG